MSYEPNLTVINSAHLGKSEMLSEQIWSDDCQICFTVHLYIECTLPQNTVTAMGEVSVGLLKWLYPLTDFTALGLVWAIKKEEEINLP